MTGHVITNNGRIITLNRTFLITPTLTAPNQFRVGTGTTTPLVTDTAMETAVNINGGELKSFLSGFPTLDTTNFQATTRTFLDTTEANGNSLTEHGRFNSDGTPLMFSHSVHTAVTKNSSTEITYIDKDIVS